MRNTNAGRVHNPEPAKTLLAIFIILALLLSSLPTGSAFAMAIVGDGSTPPSISAPQVTVKAATDSSYVEPTNTYTDGTTKYYLVTQDPGKASLTSITYNGTSYPLTTVFVGSNLSAMKIGSNPILTQNGPLSNATVFFDDGTYTDNDSTNYVGLSQPNMSLIGLNKTGSGEPAVILHKAPRSSTIAAINNTEERYIIMTSNIYLENLIFDNQGYDMYPTGDKSLSIPKSRGEYMFYFSTGSGGFVMKDCILENVGASNQDTGINPAYYNKNLAMNFYQSAGQHNFENVTIRNVKTTAVAGVGLGIISFNQSSGNYFKNLTIVDDDAYNSISRSIMIEHRDTSVVPEKGNSAIFTGTLSLPVDSYHNHVYIQSWNYDNIVTPANYRYALYSSTNGNSFGTPAILVYQDVMPPVTAGKSILDLKDTALLVQDGTSVSIYDQLNTMATMIKNAGTHAPGYNIKIAADSSGKINSFVIPSFGSGVSVNLVAIPNSPTLFTSSDRVPLAAGGTIQLPAATAGNITLYNFDFASLAKYSLQEVISGITPLATITDPNDNGSITGYPSYTDYAPKTATTAAIKNATVTNFSNCAFTSLANEIKITNPVAAMTVGATYTLTGSLAGTSTDSFTGTTFTGTIKDTADDKTIYWFSSDPLIATVDKDSGLVSAVKVGTVTILAKAADTNNNGEIEKPYASFNLSVTKAGGSGSGSGSGSASAAVGGALEIPITALPVPATGFAPGVRTMLPGLNTANKYQDLGDLWLEIPTLGLQTSITGVPQTTSGWDISWLDNEAGWLNGSAYPTYSGNSVLTGHVYNSDGLPGIFANLNQLKYGDEVIVHAWGQQYIYSVRDVKTISPDNSTYVFKHRESPWLTLLTCKGFDESSGKYKERLAVRAVLIKVK
jgi:LPXTG-site transpeptidase (sortase) family protein